MRCITTQAELIPRVKIKIKIFRCLCEKFCDENITLQVYLFFLLQDAFLLYHHHIV